MHLKLIIVLREFLTRQPSSQLASLSSPPIVQISKYLINTMCGNNFHLRFFTSFFTNLFSVGCTPVWCVCFIRKKNKCRVYICYLYTCTSCVIMLEYSILNYKCDFLSFLFQIRISIIVCHFRLSSTLIHDKFIFLRFTFSFDFIAKFI